MIQSWSAALVIILAWAIHNPYIRLQSTDTVRIEHYSKLAWRIAKTGANPDEAKQLAKIAIHESTLREHAIGPFGERGLFQIMPPNPPTDKEALRLLRFSYKLCGGLQWYTSGQCNKGFEKAKEILAIGEYSRE